MGRGDRARKATGGVAESAEPAAATASRAGEGAQPAASSTAERMGGHARDTSTRAGAAGTAALDAGDAGHPHRAHLEARVGKRTGGPLGLCLYFTSRAVREARIAGIPALGGLDMVLAQGRKQFEIWTGEPAPTGPMRSALLKRVR